MPWKQFPVPVEDLNADEVKAYMEGHQEGAYTLLDVRQPTEYEKRHIPGSKLIPLPELTDHLKELDHERPVITY